MAWRAGRNIRHIPARTVILSAGALGSPTILLRSGVRNDQIGRGVILHPSIPIFGKFDHTIDALNGTQASVFVDDALITDGYALESMSAEPAYTALMWPGPPLHTFELVKEFRNLAGFGVMLVDTPSSQNRARFSGRTADRLHPFARRQRTSPAWPEAGGSHSVLAGANEVYLPTTEDVFGGNQDGAEELRPAVLRDSQRADAVCDRLQFIPNRTILTSAHMQATDKMGPNPASSVVSRNFRVWGVDRLYVVDGSIFPTSIGANAMQSIYTFAKIFADRMQ